MKAALQNAKTMRALGIVDLRWDHNHGAVSIWLLKMRDGDVADNLSAIAATLEAMRAIERHGGGTILERAFLGFAALPERATQHWREVLGIEGSATPQLIEDRFRALAQVHHPDKGGDRNKFEEIVQARYAARLELAS